MKNFQITAKEDDKQYWISRSCAVVAIVIRQCENGDGYEVLVNKRGPGTPDYQGYWNLPCGYIDWDECGEVAASREVNEETNYVIPTNQWTLMSADTNPRSNRQNITLRYFHFVQFPPLEISENNNGEENEVDDVKWINLDNLNDYQFAFDHEKLIINIFDDAWHRGLI